MPTKFNKRNLRSLIENLYTMNKKVLFTILVFALALLVFNIYTTKIMFTDVAQYLNVAKEFANIAVSKVRNTPGYAYGFILGKVLEFSPNPLTAKLFNALWLVLDGILLYLITKRASSLLFWIFSPIVWYMGSWISPLMPVSFLFLFAYYNIKRFEKTNKKRYLALSGLSLGLSAVLWWAAVYISAFFVLSFLSMRKLIVTIFFSICFALAFSLRILFDYTLFNMPFYSSLKGLGSNVAYGIGIAGSDKALTTILGQLALLLIIISPVLYRFYRVNPIEYSKEYLFLFLTSVLFIANLQLRYFIVIAPIIFFIFSEFTTARDLKLHILISLFIIFFITRSYFGITEDYLITQDLEKLTADFPNERFIVGTEKVSEGYADFLSTLYWGDKVKEFIEYTEYKLSLKNESIFRSYSLSSEPKINDLRKIDLTLNYLRTDERSYEDVKLLVIVGNQEQPEGFKLAKEYEILRVFQKI